VRRLGGWVDLHPRGPRSCPSYAVSNRHYLIDPIRPTRERFHRMAAYTQCQQGMISESPEPPAGLVTAVFAATAFTVVFVDLLFRFVITGSPKKPKGPGEGAL
jgi:hypothetical protein